MDSMPTIQEVPLRPTVTISACTVSSSEIVRRKSDLAEASTTEERWKPTDVFLSAASPKETMATMAAAAEAALWEPVGPSAIGWAHPRFSRIALFRVASREVEMEATAEQGGNGGQGGQSFSAFGAGGDGG